MGETGKWKTEREGKRVMCRLKIGVLNQKVPELLER
jgi:hypothetical protein